MSEMACLSLWCESQAAFLQVHEGFVDDDRAQVVAAFVEAESAGDGGNLFLPLRLIRRLPGLLLRLFLFLF